jgi:hypothetical protein
MKLDDVVSGLCNDTSGWYCCCGKGSESVIIDTVVDGKCDVDGRKDDVCW